MTDDRKSGIALIVGSLGGVLTMAIHPTGAGASLPPEQVAHLWKHMLGDVPAAAHQWRIVMYGVFQINQAFSRIYAVGSSMAILLWPVAGLRNGGLRRSVTVYGCVVAALITSGIVIGDLRLDVHGMAIVVVAQTLWFIAVGWQVLFDRRT